MDSSKIIDEISAAHKAGKKPVFSYDRVSTEEQKTLAFPLIINYTLLQNRCKWFSTPNGKQNSTGK